MSHYLYENASSRELLNTIEHAAELPQNPRIVCVSNGIILPRKEGGEKNWGLGGVVDENGEFVVESSDPKFGGFYDTTGMQIVDYDLDVLYLGYLIPHWGTFLVDFTRRLYAFYELDDNIRIAFNGLQFDPGIYGAITEKVLEFLDLAGIDKLQMMDIRTPSRFRKIFVPELGFQFNESWYKQYLVPFRRIVEKVKVCQDRHEPAKRKVYLSRTKLLKKKEFGERYIITFPNRRTI